MIRLHMNAVDLGLVRFAIAPLWETVTSLRALNAPEVGQRLHQPWREDVLARLARPAASGVDLSLLTTLVRPAGYIPDILVPSPPRRVTSFERAIEQIAVADPQEVSRQLLHLADHPVASAGPRRAERTRRLQSLAANPRAALDEITAALTAYWRVAVAPYWPRLNALLRRDIAERLDTLAEGGVQELLRTLHPSVSFDGRTVHVRKYYDGDAELGGRGLLLVPCAFAWPDVIVLTAQPHVPTMSYSPRGLGTLWQRHPTRRGTALAAVIGRTRATLLAQLDLPMSTTQIAAALDLSAPTLNAHLHALRDAGIVTSRRDGRTVLYARAPLGDRLLAGAEDTTGPVA